MPSSKKRLDSKIERLQRIACKEQDRKPGSIIQFYESYPGSATFYIWHGKSEASETKALLEDIKLPHKWERLNILTRYKEDFRINGDFEKYKNMSEFSILPSSPSAIAEYETPVMRFEKTAVVGVSKKLEEKGFEVLCFNHSDNIGKYPGIIYASEFKKQDILNNIEKEKTQLTKLQKSLYRL
ncbi:hypothetical protein GF336_02070 [Candidatus Woesearchaeota archaeon]|nr:hypothetical protein [Candidatus Woesearchaeota archaeon]